MRKFIYGFEPWKFYCRQFHLFDTVGIDARVVTGYVAREYDAEARRYVVRDAHAHAWVEVRSGSYRYSPVDPTPPSALPAGVGPPLHLADRLDWLYRRLEGSWASAVIGFDGRTQAHLLDTLDIGWSRRVGELGRSTRDWMARVNRAFYFGSAGYIWLGIVALAGVIALVAVVKIVRRYRRLRRGLGLRGMGAGESRRLLRQAGFYLDMLIVLERAGVPKPHWQPPLAFARGLRGRFPTAADLVRKISSSYYKARYAGRRLSSDEVTRAEQRVRELATELGGRR